MNALCINLVDLDVTTLPFEAPGHVQMLILVVQSVHIPGLRHAILCPGGRPHSDTRTLRQSNWLQANS